MLQASWPPFRSNTDTHSHLVVSVGVGCSSVVVGAGTAVCNQGLGSVECRGLVPDCSAGPCSDCWNQSGVIRSGWRKQEQWKKVSWKNVGEGSAQVMTWCSTNATISHCTTLLMTVEGHVASLMCTLEAASQWKHSGFMLSDQFSEV